MKGGVFRLNDVLFEQQSSTTSNFEKLKLYEALRRELKNRTNSTSTYVCTERTTHYVD